MGVLLVMNLQNSYFSKDGSVYLGEKAEVLKVRLKDYLASYKGKRYFCKELHSKSDKFFVGEKTHSITSSPDSEFFSDFTPYADFIVHKFKYDAFFGTELESYLSGEQAREVTIVGVETHTSVLFTAEELRNRDYQVNVIEPLTASRNDYLHDAAVTLMGNFLGVTVE